MGDPIQLEPFDVATDEEELRRRERERQRRALAEMAASTPHQADIDAQVDEEAARYRAMSNADADAIESRARDTGPGGRVYAAGDMPPPENQRQRALDRRIARGSAATSGQMAALDAPTERQRPTWMQDRESPAGDLRDDEVAFRTPTTPGNVDMSTRPRVRNADGSVSTVRSMSIGTDEGEVLIPTVGDEGRVLSDDDAIRRYRETGRHLGVFQNPNAATAGAQALHESEARRIAQPSAPAEAQQFFDQAPYPNASPAGGTETLPPSSPPAGRDYTGADWGDALRRPFYAIAEALRTAGTGQAPRAFRSEGQHLREQDQQQALRDQQREDRLRANALTRNDRQSALDAQRSLQREQMDRTDARSREAMQRRAELAAQDPRRLTFMQEMQRREALRDVNSPETEDLREAVRRGRNLLPPEIQRRFDLSDEGLASMRGSMLERILPLIPRPSVGIRSTRAGGGSAAGGAASPQRVALHDRALGAGMTEQDVTSYPNTRQGQQALLAEISRRETEARAQGRRPQEGGRVPLIEMGDGRRVLGADYVTDPEARGFRDGFARAGAAQDAITALNQINSRYGLEAVINPQVESEVAPFVMTLRGIATELQNTGTINAGEAPIINDSLPDPTHLRGMTMRSLQNAVNAWRQALENRMIRRARALGVHDEDDLNALRSELRAATGTTRGAREQAPTPEQRTQPAAPTSEDRVRVRAPDGRTGTVLRTEVPDGWEVVDG